MQNLVNWQLKKPEPVSQGTESISVPESQGLLKLVCKQCGKPFYISKTKRGAHPVTCRAECRRKRDNKARRRWQRKNRTLNDPASKAVKCAINVPSPKAKLLVEIDRSEAPRLIKWLIDSKIKVTLV